jgi:hypothetical protein
LFQVKSFTLYFTGDLEGVLKQVEAIRDDSSRGLDTVCDVSKTPEAVKDLKTYLPQCNPWKLDHKVLAMLPEFGEKTQSYIFCHKLADTAAKMGDLSGSQFWGAFLQLWLIVNKQWQDLCSTMANGTITIAQTEKVRKKG